MAALILTCKRRSAGSTRTTNQRRPIDTADDFFDRDDLGRFSKWREDGGGHAGAIQASPKRKVVWQCHFDFQNAQVFTITLTPHDHDPQSRARRRRVHDHDHDHPEQSRASANASVQRLRGREAAAGCASACAGA